MKILSRHLITGVMAGVFATAAFAQNMDVIKTRQDAMKANGKAMKTLAPMAKGEAEFDQMVAMQALGILNTNAKAMADLFPEDSKTGEDTEASPAIWENRAGFDEQVQKFIADTDAALASDPQDAQALGQAIAMFAGDCKSCHEDFRVKKK